MKVLLTSVFLFVSFLSLSQGDDLTFGKVLWADMDMKVYPRDTSAVAVVLNEIGSAYISHNSDGGLIFQRYLKIKILKRQGFDLANFQVLLHKQDNVKENLISVVASTYNLEDGRIKEIKMDRKSVFTENRSKFTDLVKFTLPDIREGSVIEVLYKLNSPFIFSFRSWEFQSDIPKIHSEYLALIPGNYLYNITLRGFRSLSKNESSIVKDCFVIGSGKAECSLTKYAMDNIPAFIEEDRMTARSNFESAIHFELSEIRYFDGRVDKKTKEWKDVDQELRQYEDFGTQIRKAKGLLSDKVKSIVGPETDTLKRARSIYDFVKSWYVWNDNYGKFTELGVKKAFENKKGNDADINLSLVGALQSGGINSFPVLLSTRENGLVNSIHPVITDFNYVVASADIGGTRYLLDATSVFQPFGFLPMRCINGKGRLMAKESFWTDLKPRDKQKRTLTAELTLTDDGYQGTFTFLYHGYEAVAKRLEIMSAVSALERNAVPELSEYTRSLQNKWKEIEVSEHKVSNLDSLEKPLEEKMTVKVNSGQPGAKTIFFNPFVIDRWERNPFKSSERLYPVDFGAPLEQLLILKLTYPATYLIDELPAPMSMSLPQGGGRFLFNVSNIGNVVSITSNLTLNRSVYNSGEYGAIKELFARLVQINQSQIVFKRK